MDLGTAASKLGSWLLSELLCNPDLLASTGIGQELRQAAVNFLERCTLSISGVYTSAGPLFDDEPAEFTLSSHCTRFGEEHQMAAGHALKDVKSCRQAVFKYPASGYSIGQANALQAWSLRREDQLAKVVRGANCAEAIQVPDVTIMRHSGLRTSGTGIAKMHLSKVDSKPEEVAFFCITLNPNSVSETDRWRVSEVRLLPVDSGLPTGPSQDSSTDQPLLIPCHGNLGPRDSGAFIWAIGKSDPIHEGEGLLVGGKEDSNELRLLRHAAILEVADTVKDLPGVGLHQSPVPPAQAEARFQAICKQLPWDRQEDVIPFKTQVMIRNKKQLKLAHAMIETFNEADIGKKGKGPTSIVECGKDADFKKVVKKNFAEPMYGNIISSARIDYGDKEHTVHDEVHLQVQCSGFSNDGNVFADASVPEHTKVVKVFSGTEGPMTHVMAGTTKMQKSVAIQSVDFTQYVQNQLKASLDVDLGLPPPPAKMHRVM